MRPRTSPTDPHADPAGDLAVAIAGHGLGSGLPLPTEPVSDFVFNDLLRVAERERVVGAVTEAAVDGVLPLTAEQLESLTNVHRLWSRHALDLESLLVRFDAACEQAGIHVRVLKGVALAHVAFDNPSFRVFGDLDVMVPADRFDDVVSLAQTSLGGVQSIPELRAGFDHEFGKAALVSVGRLELDIHRTFVTGPFGLTVDLNELFATSSRFALGGRELHALDRAPLFLHTCYNAALGDLPPRLGPLRDLAVVGRAIETDASEIESLAAEWQANAVVRRAAELTVESLGLDGDSLLTELTRLPVGRREQWLLQSYLSSARSYSRPLASLAVIPGIGTRVRYARALVAPSTDYLRSRGLTERSHLLRARDRLLGRG